MTIDSKKKREVEMAELRKEVERRQRKNLDQFSGELHVHVRTKSLSTAFCLYSQGYTCIELHVYSIKKLKDEMHIL